MGLEIFLTQTRSRKAHSQYLQRAAQIVDLVNILSCKCACPETAPGIRTHQSFLNETLQSLPHRCATHSQLLRKRNIRKPLLFAPADHDNALPDLFIRVINNSRYSAALLAPEQIK